MRVGIITNSLQGGGAERQAALWATVCANLGHEVTVMVLNRGPIEFKLPAGVHVRWAEKSGRFDLRRVAGHVRALGHYVDVAVAFQRYPALFCALTRLPVPWLVVTGDDPRHWRDTSAMPNAVFKVAFRQAAVACAPSRGVIDYHKKLGIRPAGPWIRVPNIVAEEAFVRNGTRNGALFVGRLTESKNPLLAVDAALKARVPLTILGRGELKPAIERMLARADPTGAVSLHAFTSEPWSLYARHRALLVTSRHETFGNVIVESLAAGTPVVAADCDFGPAEILSGALYSEVVEPDAAVLATALGRVMGRPYAAEEAAECRSIAERYSVGRITPLIERALREAAGGSAVATAKASHAC